MADEEKVLDMIQKASYFHDDLIITKFTSKSGKHTRQALAEFNDTYAIEETRN